MKAIMTVPRRERFRRRLLATLVVLSAGGAGMGYADAGEVGGSIPSSGSGFEALPSMDLEAMAQARGREGVNVHLDSVNVQSIQDLNAISVGSDFNVINGDMMTGSITFEQGSMGHFSGTGIFNSITGNANAVNNAIGISVYIQNP
ncbi:hypothetical protein MKP05_04145 [Halomonas sp. EGI 63088]|uniref:Uncharacterized protein n=1 Tax=Halomonas flagellata TaxID=2920385 RepID=A0ABS9RR42_9GAMM|nr:hypothetical protein [Halomonas flagellata]MCH4562323.1 hypothetical protein [Halomonas flagellata]